MKINIETNNCIINKSCTGVIFNPVNQTFFIKGINIKEGEFDSDDEITVEYKDEISIHINYIHGFEIKDQ